MSFLLLLVFYRADPNYGYYFFRNFLDVGDGATAYQVKEAFRLITSYSRLQTAKLFTVWF